MLKNWHLFHRKICHFFTCFRRFRKSDVWYLNKWTLLGHVRSHNSIHTFRFTPSHNKKRRLMLFNAIFTVIIIAFQCRKYQTSKSITKTPVLCNSSSEVANQINDRQFDMLEVTTLFIHVVEPYKIRRLILSCLQKLAKQKTIFEINSHE